MTRWLAAAMLLAAATFATGALCGWSTLPHATRGEEALSRATSSGREADVTAALAELGAALAANPLSREDRLAYARAVDLALERLGPDRLAAVDPPSTLARAVTAAALEGQGAWQAARALRRTLGPTRGEEIALLSDAQLAALGTAAAVAHACEPALPLLEEASRRQPGALRLELDFATCLGETGDWSRALPILGALVADDPDAQWIRFRLAEAYLALGELEEAESVSRALVTRFQTFYFAWRQRGDILKAAGMPSEAAFAYRRALALRPRNRWLGYVARDLERQARAAQP